MATAQPDICTICLEQPKTPTSLPTCTHTFCRQCLNSYVKRHEAEETVKCPTCTIACPMQDISREDPQTEEPEKLARKKELCTFCSYKGTESEAESFCEGCDDAFLCQDCAASHGKKPRFSGHALKPLSAYIHVKLARCQQHPGRNLKFVCIGCDEAVCEICADIAHDDHELVDIQETKAELLNTFEPADAIGKHVSNFHQNLKNIRIEEESTIATIEKHAEFIKREVDKRKDTLVAEVRAKLGGKQLYEDTTNLAEHVQATLTLSRDVFDQDASNSQDVSTLRSTKDTLITCSQNVPKKLVELESRLQAACTPRYTPMRRVALGNLEYLPKSMTVPVRLGLGGKNLRQPCYGIRTAFPFRRQDIKTTAYSPQLAFIEKNRPGQLILTNNEQLISAERFGDWVDMIVNDVTLIILNTDESKFPLSFKFMNQDGKVSLSTTSANPPASYSYSTWKYLMSGLSFTLTKTGRIAILCKQAETEYYNKLVVLLPDLQLWRDPISLPVSNLADDVKIYCPESLDLLLIHDRKGNRVISISYDVRRETELKSDGSIGGLSDYFIQKKELLSPVNGYYIKDICCDRGKVYLCIKQGQQPPAPSKPPEPGPIQFYQASLVRDKWHFTAIPLEHPSGKPFSELKQDETLHFGVHQGTVMCLVVRPIPLAELKVKESKEPGMYLTWYHGKLP